MSDSIITYAVLNDEGFMVRRFQNIHEARRLRDAIKTPTAIRREWWRLDEDETEICETQVDNLHTSGTSLEWPPREGAQ